MSADDGAARVARDVRVHGLVQGVAFRYTARREAESRGVTGWVRNEVDGSVAAHLEGRPDSVAAMVEWCRAGPRWAQVDRVEVNETDVRGATSFDVLG